MPFDQLPHNYVLHSLHYQAKEPDATLASFLNDKKRPVCHNSEVSAHSRASYEYASLCCEPKNSILDFFLVFNNVLTSVSLKEATEEKLFASCSAVCNTDINLTKQKRNDVAGGGRWKCEMEYHSQDRTYYFTLRDISTIGCLESELHLCQD